MKKELAIIGMGLAAAGGVYAASQHEGSTKNTSPYNAIKEVHLPKGVVCAYDYNLSAASKHCVPPKPTATHNVSPTSITSLETRMTQAQANLQPVNSAKREHFMSIIRTEGYTDTHKYMHDVRRYVVEAPNGTVYTDELDYAKPFGESDNILKAITVYIRKPGEPFAKQVVEDGTTPGNGHLEYPLDGVVDDALGYHTISTHEIKSDVSQYHTLGRVGGVEALEAIQAAGKTAQHDYATAVNLTVHQG